ncbi:DUF4339 domain-containing protein [bacterium]|nr:DUF4339 domain-containing protein [bacterium]
MSSKWFVVRGGEERGPFTPQRLREMAASGELRPEDKVRREDLPAARPASTVKGLFPGDGGGTGAAPAAAKAAKPPVTRDHRPRPDSPPGNTSGSRKHLIVLSAVVGVMFLTCAGVVGVVGVVATKARRSAEQGLAEADRAWDAGDKAGAATKYRDLLQDRGRKALLKPDEKGRLFGRLIDYDTERGEAGSAKALLAEAASGNVTPQVGHPEAKKLLAVELARARGEVLTADFYPHKPGTAFRTFQTGIVFGADVDTEREYAHLDGGVVEVRTHRATIVRPARRELPPSPPVKLLRRERGGFLEVGKENAVLKGVTSWTPLLKLGALAGDEWEGGSMQYPSREVPHDPKGRYRVVRFSEEPLPPGVAPGDRAMCATVEETLVDKEGVSGVIEYHLAKGIGIVRKTGFDVKDGARKETFSEAVVPTTKR